MPDRPEISVSPGAVLIALALAAVFLAGDVILPDLLGLDLDCADIGSGRRARFVESLGCSAAAGPKGWLFLVWLAAPIALLGWWLRTSLRRVRARGHEQHGGPQP